MNTCRRKDDHECLIELVVSALFMNTNYLDFLFFLHVFLLHLSLIGFFVAFLFLDFFLLNFLSCNMLGLFKRTPLLPLDQSLEIEEVFPLFYHVVERSLDHRNPESDRCQDPRDTHIVCVCVCVKERLPVATIKGADFAWACLKAGRGDKIRVDGPQTRFKKKVEKKRA